MHWLPLSVTNSLTNSCLVDLIYVTLACEDANSKLVEVINVADVDGGKRVGDSLVQIFHSICHQQPMINDNHPSIHYPTKPLNEMMSGPCQDDLQ